MDQSHQPTPHDHEEDKEQSLHSDSTNTWVRVTLSSPGDSLYNAIMNEVTEEIQVFMTENTTTYERIELQVKFELLQILRVSELIYEIRYSLDIQLS